MAKKSMFETVADHDSQVAPVLVQADATGTNGNDTLQGDSTLIDTINGLGGDDTIIAGTDPTTDYLDGGTGTDTVDYSATTGGITLHLDGQAVVTGPEGGSYTGAATGTEIGTDYLVNIENAIGGSGADTLIGSADDNTLIGGAGNDTLSGGQGDDTAYIAASAANGIAVQSSITQVISTADGIDRVSTVEHIHFNDVTIDVDTGGNAILQTTADVKAVAGGASVTTTGDTGALTGAAPYGTGVLANDLDIDDRMTVSGIAHGGTAGTVGTSLAGSYGHLTIGADGGYTYVADNAVSLGAGAPGSDVFTYTATDGTDPVTGTLTFSVTGTNDAPVVTALTHATVDDDGEIVTVDLLGGQTDPDTGDTLSAAGIVVTALIHDPSSPADGTTVTIPATTAGGTVNYVVAADGHTISFDPRTFDRYNVGQSADVTVSYNVQDDHGGTTPNTLKFAVAGANDAAVFGQPDGYTASASDTDASITGTVHATDVDNSPVGYALSGNGVGSEGSFAIDASGAWTYTLAASATALGASEHATDVFTVTTADGTTDTVTITVQGTNQAATFTGDTQTVNAAADTVTGTVVVTDVDSAATITSGNIDMAGDYGTLVLDAATGAYTYTLDHDATGPLGGTDVVTDSFDFTTADGTAGHVVITIDGQDVTGVGIAGDTGAITEDGNPDGEGGTTLVTGGTVVVTDDSLTADAVFAATSTLTTDHGAFTLDGDGNWTFTVDTGTTQSLNVGDHYTDTLTFSDGGDVGTIAVEITGSNDPLVTEGGSAILTNDNAGTIAVNLLSDATDADNAPYLDAVTAVSVLDAAGHVVGTLPDAAYTIDDAGVFHLGTSYFDALNVGGLDQVRVEYTVASDGSPAVSDYRVILVQGADDAATLAATTATTAEDTVLHGQIVTTDVDGPGSAVANPITLISGPAHGTITLEADGSYTYTPDADFNGTDTFYVSAGGAAPAAGLTNSLLNTLGGDTGFGEQVLSRGDDGYQAVDLTSAFSNGITLAGVTYSTVSIGRNGSVVLGNNGLAGDTDTPLNAAGSPTFDIFSADTDTRSATAISPGGNSEGTNRIYYDLDAATHTLTVTYDDVGQYQRGTVPNAYQMQIHQEADGSLDVTYRYENVNWTGNTYAGVSDGTDAHLVSLLSTDGGDTSAEQLALATAVGNTGAVGVYQFHVGTDGTVAVADSVPVTITVTPVEDAPVIAPGTALANVASERDGTVAFDLSTAGSDVDGDALSVAAGATVNLVSANGTMLGTLDPTAYSFTGGTFDLNTSYFAGQLHYGDHAYVQVTYHLTDGQETSTNAATYTIDVQGDRELVTLTAGADSYSGSNAYADEIHALAGDDVVKGLGGDDLIYGDDGNDTLYGNVGNDQLFGGAGNDHLDGGQGNDTLFGGAGDDFLEGGAGDDYLIGGDPNVGPGGVDTVTYLHAASAVTVDLNLQFQVQDTVGAGHDGLAFITNLQGSNYNDTLTGDANANLIQGGLGNDTISGNDGNDTLYGNQGADTIKGGLGNDYINGGQDNDTLYGNQGADQLHGGLGDDYVNGGQDNDTLYGEAGTNTLVGGAGADIFVMSLLGHDTITDFDETAGDKIDLAGIDAISTNGAGTVDHFTYAGNAFTSVAGQLIVVADPTDTTGTHFLVEGDRDGDGHADYTATVVTTHAIDQNAFILSHDNLLG